MSQTEVDTQRRERLLFLGSSLVLVTTLLVGISKEQHWGERFLNLTLVARNADGLKAGQEVRISGLQVGQLKSLTLNTNAKVTVRLQVAEKYAHLVGPKTEASQAQVGFVGDHYLVLSPDPTPSASGRPVDGHAMQNRTIPYRQPAAISSLMQELQETQSLLQATLRNTSNLTAEEGSVNARLQQLNTTLANASSLSASIQREVGPISAQTQTTEREAQALLRDTRPLVISTLKELKELASTRRRMLQGVSALVEPWLEPANQKEPANQSEPLRKPSQPSRAVGTSSMP